MQMSDAVTDQIEPRRAPRVGVRAVLRAILKHKLSRVGIIFITLLVSMALLAPWLAPYDPNKQDLYDVLSGPSKKHWLGTDNVGRDLLSRVMYGARISLMVGVLGTLLAATIGSLIGLVSGYRGGVVDMVVMRITDTFMSIPWLVFILVMAAALGPGLKNIIIALGALGWTGFARIIRGQVLTVRELPYVEASRVSGATGMRIMFKHLLPNSVAPIIVAFGLIGTWLQNLARIVITVIAGYYWGSDALESTHYNISYVIFPLWYAFFAFIYLRVAKRKLLS